MTEREFLHNEILGRVFFRAFKLNTPLNEFWNMAHGGNKKEKKEDVCGYKPISFPLRNFMSQGCLRLFVRSSG